MKYLLGLLAMVLTLTSQSSYALLENSIAATRQDRVADQAREYVIQIKGMLGCETTQGLTQRKLTQTNSICILKIRDRESGKIFGLIDAKAAMALYNAGSYNVLIEGILRDVNTIQIKTAQNL